jgi:hypothetical protein
VGALDQQSIRGLQDIDANRDAYSGAISADGNIYAGADEFTCASADGNAFAGAVTDTSTGPDGHSRAGTDAKH